MMLVTKRTYTAGVNTLIASFLWCWHVLFQFDSVLSTHKSMNEMKSMRCICQTFALMWMEVKGQRHHRGQTPRARKGKPGGVASQESHALTGNPEMQHKRWPPLPGITRPKLCWFQSSTLWILLALFLSHPLPPPAIQGCFRYGHFDTNRYWQIRLWNELITRRLDTRSCPLPNYKRSCMFTEPWIPIHSRLFLAGRLCDDGRAALRLTYDEFHKLINCFVGYVKTCSTNQFMIANVGTGIKCLVAFVGGDSLAKLAKLITSCSLLMTALAV